MVFSFFFLHFHACLHLLHVHIICMHVQCAHTIAIWIHTRGSMQCQMQRRKSQSSLIIRCDVDEPQFGYMFSDYFDYILHTDRETDIIAHTWHGHRCLFTTNTSIIFIICNVTLQQHIQITSAPHHHHSKRSFNHLSMSFFISLFWRD